MKTISEFKKLNLHESKIFEMIHDKTNNTLILRIDHGTLSNGNGEKILKPFELIITDIKSIDATKKDTYIFDTSIKKEEESYYLFTFILFPSSVTSNNTQDFDVLNISGKDFNLNITHVPDSAKLETFELQLLYFINNNGLKIDEVPVYPNLEKSKVKKIISKFLEMNLIERKHEFYLITFNGLVVLQNSIHYQSIEKEYYSFVNKDLSLKEERDAYRLEP